MEDSKIVPDVVDSAPTKMIEIKYGDLTLLPGNVLTPTQVKAQPSFAWEADPSKFYLLCMTDPDNVPVEKRGTPGSQWHHFLVGNIQGSDISTGEVLSEYIGSGPPEGTGLHRYVFLVFEQPGKLTFDAPKLGQSIEGRADFDIREFVKKNGVGPLVAANFYLAEFDSWVPELYKSLGA